MTQIFLVVLLNLPSGTEKIRDQQMPSLEACWAEAQKEMDKISKIDAVFEVQVSCNFLREPAEKNPA